MHTPLYRFIEVINRNASDSQDFIHKKLYFLENLVGSDIFAHRNGRSCVIVVVTETLKNHLEKSELGFQSGTYCHPQRIHTHFFTQANNSHPC